MGYYHIKLSPGAKHLCTILIPWEGGYEYHKLPVGGCEIPDIFQVNISELFEVFYMVRKYIDNVLAINKNWFADYLNALDRVLQKLMEEGLKLNA